MGVYVRLCPCVYVANVCVAPGQSLSGGKVTAIARPADTPYFLVTVVQVLKQVSEYAASASAIVRLGYGA
jgi:hypothetical protein